MNKKAYGIANGMGIIILLALWNYGSLRFQNKLNSFLDRNSEAYRNYEEYSRQFPSGGDTWVVILDFQKMPEFADFLRVDSLTNRLTKMDEVKRCYSMTSMRLVQRSIHGISQKTLLKLCDEVAFERSWKKLDRYPDVQYKFVSADNKATCIYLEMEEEASEELADAVKAEVESFHFPSVH